MINKEINTRIIITISKKQANWLEKQSKKLHINKSKFIAWILSKKANEIVEYLKMKNNNLSEEELAKIIEIAKEPWTK